MEPTILQLIDRLEPDPWRQANPFSPEMVEVQDLLIAKDPTAISKLGGWLQKHQPCIFGRLAAKLGFIRICVLSEKDVATDESARDIIQEARRQFTADAFEGKASAFIVMLASRRIAEAKPSPDVLAIAQRLCSLYLREVEVRVDAIHHEKVWLEKPGPARTTWEWLAGANYFCAQGDRRWWHDHRIPGGMAFSVNSVGHLARSGKLAELLDNMNAEVGLPGGEMGGGNIRSLDDALVFAMLTIDNAAEAVSGRATRLLSAAQDEEATPLPVCPVRLPAKLQGKNHCSYEGWYHTDYTLPSEYFLPDQERPANLPAHKLDFTYLFDKSVDNPAFEVMGEGRRIRAEGEGEADVEIETKRNRMLPREVLMDDCERLKASLVNRGIHQ